MIPSIFLLISSVLNLLLGIYVFLSQPGKFLNRIFFLFCLSIVGWILSIFIILNVSQSLIYGEFSFIFGAFILSFLLIFCLNIDKIKPIKNKYIALLLLPPIILAILALKGYIINSVELKENFILNTFGYLYPLFVGYIIIYTVSSFLTLIYKYKTNIGQEKIKIKYVIFGILLFVFPAVMTNLILPTLFNIWSLNGIGPSFSLFMILSMTYAIVRYHLMDIWIIIRLGTIYTILFSIISFIYALSSALLEKITSNKFSFILPAIFITFGFTFLKNFVEHITDKIFFRKHFKIEDIIGKLNIILQSHFSDLDKLLDNFNRLLIDYLRVERAAILILIPKGNFVSRQLIDGNLKELEINPDNPILNFFHNHQSEFVIDKDEFLNNPDYGEIVSEFERLNFSVAVSLKIKDKLIGVYFVGQKKSQDPFSKEEINLLKLLSTESALIIENARLFDELKKIDETKSKFISVVSHQLRTPLTSILWNLELVANENIEEKQKEELIDYTHQSASFMSEHIDDLLTVLDIEEKYGKLYLIKENINFEELLGKIIKTETPNIKKKKISLKIKPFDDNALISADQMKIKKAISILFKNAINYSPDGGEIKIDCNLKEINKKRYLIFSIGDNGIGIADDEKKIIFTKFGRGEEARKISPNGFGLGLYIVKYFIEAHGGEVWFNSNGRGRGALFSISLPVE